MGSDTGGVFERGGDVVAVECIGLLRVYETTTGRVQAVKGVDLTIDRGVSVAIVGPSGSGKSSLLRMLVGLDDPTAGEVVIGGMSIGRMPARRRRRALAPVLSHVHQRPNDNLLPYLTVRQQVERMARRRRAAAREVDELIERMGLTDRQHHLPAALSGGEQQRTAFARGAVGRPAVVVADEPTAELDEASTERVVAAMRALAEGGLTVVVATHDPLVLTGVDQVVHLDDGAVTSVSDAAGQLAVIDRAGRVQLPVDAREHFPARRARVDWDADEQTLKVTPP